MKAAAAKTSRSVLARFFVDSDLGGRRSVLAVDSWVVVARSWRVERWRGVSPHRSRRRVVSLMCC